MKETYIHPKYDLKLEKPTNSESVSHKFISYSQYQNFKKCPKYWKLCHIDRLRDSEASIHTVFGDAMHTTIQNWLKVLFLETVKKSDEMDLNGMLLEAMKEKYAADVTKSGKHFSTKEQMTEFYLDGIEILATLRKKRANYFSKKYEELIGIEIPIILPPDPAKPNIILLGYLDAVIRNTKTGRFCIKDFKTSTKGWGPWDKKDETKISQLILYKIYFSKQYSIPIDEIDVEYMVLKRKIDEDSLYPQHRIQTFEPANGKVKCKQVSTAFQQFIDTCFTVDGNYNTNYNYVAKTGRNNFNCRFCEFRDREDLCPKSSRICE